MLSQRRKLTPQQQARQRGIHFDREASPNPNVVSRVASYSCLNIFTITVGEGTNGEGRWGVTPRRVLTYVRDTQSLIVTIEMDKVDENRSIINDSMRKRVVFEGNGREWSAGREKKLACSRDELKAVPGNYWFLPFICERNTM